MNIVLHKYFRVEISFLLVLHNDIIIIMFYFFFESLFYYMEVLGKGELGGIETPISKEEP